MKKRLLLILFAAAVLIGLPLAVILHYVARGDPVQTEPQRLYHCPDSRTYLPLAGDPAKHPVKLSSSIDIRQKELLVRYTLTNTSSEPYLAYVILGGSVSDPAVVQIDLVDDAALLKKQLPAHCALGSRSERPIALEAAGHTLRPGDRFSEEFFVQLPLMANYEPRASALLAEVFESGKAKDGDRFDIPARKPSLVRRIGLGIGVAPNEEQESQLVIYDFHELDSPLEGFAYELVPLTW